MRELNAKKNCGPDDHYPRILKHCRNSLASPLCTLFNTSFKCGKIPDDCKIANIIPLYKKGAKDKVENYRPVSLTSIASKICEKIVRKSIVNFWTDHQVFIGEQFGFMKKSCCPSQLLDTFHSWAKARNDSHKVDVILLDFTKAFDSVPHQRLLANLKGYGIGGNLLNWLTYFIVGRKQRVSFRGHFSPWTMVTSSVPQGSVLGPVLFLAYINDITAGVRSSMRLFADDSKVYRIIYDENDEKQLQCDLNTLQKWSENWQLRFHLDKCEVLRVTHARDHASYPYKLSGCTLQCVTETVDLGGLIDF